MQKVSILKCVYDVDKYKADDIVCAKLGACFKLVSSGAMQVLAEGVSDFLGDARVKVLKEDEAKSLIDAFTNADVTAGSFAKYKAEKEAEIQSLKDQLEEVKKLVPEETAKKKGWFGK